uniref:Uncharacterized protein LOC113797706 n=1 Tax=Dermatophagoides pteronyssinus TaxID=6956 RepID=A0A6P6YEM6_DERPT|nr:uncharacterized protein LOC113797706 [Dermatophagoides pteronyssinus]
MYRSNMKFLYIFYLILMITPEIRTDNEVKIIAIHKDPICESLKNNNGTQFNIVAIGTTSKRLLLITKNYYVYDVPINSLDLVHDKLHLPTKPTPIRDKYPILFNSQGFRLILSARLNLDAYIINDGKNDWVFFGERLKVHYNIDTSEVFTKLVPYDKKNKVFVSSDMPRHYYSLVRVNNNLFMSIDRYDDDSDFSNMSTIQTEGAKYSICSNPQNTRIRMEKGKCRSGIPVQWPVLKGFASDGKFYLFSQKYIFILDEDVYNNQGEEYPVQKISFDSFFNCAGIIPASNVITKSYFYWIMVAIILLLVILLTILGCIVVPRGRRRMRSSFVNGKTGDNQTTEDIFPTSTKYKKSKDKICNKVIDAGADSNGLLYSFVLAIGRTKKRVLLITKGLDVYDVPADSYDSSKNKMYFKYMSTPMKDKYPDLYHNPLFQSIKNNMNVGIMYDSDGDWICMTTNNSKQAINYNIDTSEVHKGFVLSGEWPEILISTNEPCKFYSIQIRNATKANILSATALWLTAYKCKNGDHIINSDGIEKVTDFRMLCFDYDDDYILMIEGTKCDSKKTLEWLLASGFEKKLQ